MHSGAATVTTTITYTYDSLYRLTAADYDTGEYFHYTYDDVGNRLTEEKKTTPDGAVETTSYTYDDANRMTSAGGVEFEWDNNGNLINDGANTYTYNHSNRLTIVDAQSMIVIFSYNGLGDRLSETINGVTTIYTLDLNAGLTQVLADNSHVYLYGLGRFAQTSGSESVYFLGDALGSVRQLTDGQGMVVLAQSYEPYGSVLSTAGVNATKYGFTGEWQENNRVFLRSREYDTTNGIFISKDNFAGFSDNSISQNPWNYSWSNPVLFSDPSGQSPWWCDGYFGSENKTCEMLWSQDQIVYPPRFNTTEVDQPPVSSIVWEPSVFAKPSSRLPVGWNATTHPKDAAQNVVYERNGDETRRYGPNLCGQISLSYVLEGITGNEYALNDILDVDTQIPATVCGGTDAEGYPATTSACYLKYIINGWNSVGGAFKNTSFSLTLGSNRQFTITKTWNSHSYLYGNWWEANGGLHSQLSTMMSQGHYIIANVLMQSNNVMRGVNSHLRGDIVAPNKRLMGDHWEWYWGTGDDAPQAGVAQHWVVITGFSTPWVNEEDSMVNWVRIMNPFYNREEYYPWVLFKQSMYRSGAGPHILEVWLETSLHLNQCG